MLGGSQLLITPAQSTRGLWERQHLHTCTCLLKISLKKNLNQFSRKVYTTVSDSHSCRTATTPEKPRPQKNHGPSKATAPSQPQTQHSHGPSTLVIFTFPTIFRFPSTRWFSQHHATDIEKNPDWQSAALRLCRNPGTASRVLGCRCWASSCLWASQLEPTFASLAEISQYSHSRGKIPVYPTK